MEPGTMSDYIRKGGKERRRHKMLVTSNTEYHLKDDLCVGVRKRDSGIWVKNARALKARLKGSVSSFDEIVVGKGGPPKVGVPLLFINEDGENIVTTSVTEIKRPPKEAIENYVTAPPPRLDNEPSNPG
jgi:hypothetical protein